MTIEELRVLARARGQRGYTELRKAGLTIFLRDNATHERPVRPCNVHNHSLTMVELKAIFHLTISMHVECATGKIQRNNYHHGSCGPSLTGKTMSVFLIFKQGTHRNVKNR